MLELRPNCECCGRDLPPDAQDVFICTFECTWCGDCVRDRLDEVCPNCGGNLAPRPIRPARLLATNPPSTKRVLTVDCPEAHPARRTASDTVRDAGGVGPTPPAS